MNFEQWWEQILKEWTFPSGILNNKTLFRFLKMVARDAYKQENVRIETIRKK